MTKIVKRAAPSVAPKAAPKKTLPVFEMDFELEKETPNTQRFVEQTEEGKPPLVRTLYLQKWAIGDAKTLHVTIEVTS